MSKVMDLEGELDGLRFGSGASLWWGAGSVAAAVAVGVVGVYGDPNPKPDQKGALPYVLLLSVAVGCAVFGFVVPLSLRALRRRGAGVKAGLALSVLGLVAVPVAFWSGIPLVLGAAGCLVGSRVRRVAESSGGHSRAAVAAVTAGGLAVAGDVGLVALSVTLFSS